MSSSDLCGNSASASRPFNKELALFDIALNDDKELSDLEKLPKALLARVCYFLEIPDLAAFSKASKTCYNTANELVFV